MNFKPILLEAIDAGIAFSSSSISTTEFMVIIMFIIMVSSLIYASVSKNDKKYNICISAMVVVIIIGAVSAVSNLHTKPERVAKSFITAYFESNGSEATEHMSNIMFVLEAKGDKEEADRAKEKFSSNVDKGYVTEYTISKIDAVELEGYERDEYIDNFLHDYFSNDIVNYYYDIYSDHVEEVVRCTFYATCKYAGGDEEYGEFNLYLWKEYGEWVVCEVG